MNDRHFPVITRRVRVIQVSNFRLASSPNQSLQLSPSPVLGEGWDEGIWERTEVRVFREMIE